MSHMMHMQHVSGNKEAETLNMTRLDFVAAAVNFP